MNYLPSTIPLGLLSQHLLTPVTRRPEHLAFVITGLQRWRMTQGVDESIALATSLRVTREMVAQCLEMQIPRLTLYLFSLELHDPQQRNTLVVLPTLLQLMHRMTDDMNVRNIRLSFEGKHTALPDALTQWIRTAERRTSRNTGTHISLVLDGQGGKGWPRGEGSALEISINNQVQNDPDLVIRAAGTVPTSCALVWDSAKTTLFYANTLWPDFCTTDLQSALHHFRTCPCTRGNRPGASLVH